ncbi:hypothetical protein P4493_06200 [Bacillus thuringiensis]|jgi:hypothetical protein|uniref:Uncharacterized protein n=3 Tax=Bacillus thuringiensis TaxID=1428 RepID=A0A0B5NBS2_BACTU|nr:MULTISPECIES: hypothetical protein [Bacillus]MEC2533155.1 hypothetical protein [Bacillus cereus]MED1153864.1 hypothetical protein [Bacillus paranthracis]OUB09285.1 hypothetical protein BK708_32670 [Bacillus thuringiensis serovar yunnanensis]AFQ30173.1 hypothetical protein BTF1_30362 [Bacillus thuringiensis HD-789]AJG73855.1 hypothetical protein BF38_5979 [Bacillus thuringiensis]
MLLFKIYLGVGAVVSYFLSKPKAKQLSKFMLIFSYLFTVVFWLPILILGLVVALRNSKKSDKLIDEIDINDLCDSLDKSLYFEKLLVEDGEIYRQKSETCIVCNNDNTNELIEQSESKSYCYEDVEEGKEDEETYYTTIEYSVCTVCTLKGQTGLEYIKDYVDRHKPKQQEEIE